MNASTQDAVAAGQLFGSGLPPHGSRVRVGVRAFGLALEGPAGELEEVRYSQLRPRGGGWHGDALLLDWDAEGGSRTLSVHDATALATLRAQAPEPLQKLLGRRGSGRRANLGRLLLVMGFTGLAAAVVLVVALAAGGDRLLDAAVQRVPPEWEAELGKMSVATLTAGKQVREAGEAARVVRDLGERLAAESRSSYAFRWLLVEDRQVNAAAAPGGYVVVYTGLVAAARSPEELAGVLAHEVQHVVLRHSLRAMLRGLGLRATLAVILGGSGELGGVLSRMAEQLGTLHFSRAQETEADLAGVELLRRAGIDPSGLASFFERSRDASGWGGELPAILSTHPQSEERARRVRKAIGSAAAPAPLEYDWQQVQADAAGPAPATESR